MFFSAFQYFLVLFVLVKSYRKKNKKFKTVFKTSNRLRNYFSFKDVVPEPLRSCQMYNFTCRSCNASYFGKSFRHMEVNVSEYQGVSLRRVKHLRGTLSISVRVHMFDCNRIVA